VLLPPTPFTLAKEDCMTEVNFNELLSVQVDSVERPKSFPVGHYESIVASHEMGKSSQKETPFVRFQIKLLGPAEDVDEDLFEAAGGMEALRERKPVPMTYYLTKDAMFRLREFLEEGLALNCSGRNFDEVIPESANASLTVHVSHRAGQKEGEFYMELDDYMKAA